MPYLFHPRYSALMEDVREAIMKLKRGKAAGVDNIENEGWKFGTRELQQDLLVI